MSARDPSARDLAALLPDPILLVARSGALLDANPAARHWLGLGAGPLAGVRLADLVAMPAEAERYLARCARSRQLLPGTLTWRLPGGGLGESRCDGGLLQPAANGAEAVMLLRCREKREAAVGFVALNDQLTALTREVAARRRAEADAFAQREWFRVTLSSIGDAVIATDRMGVVTFMNVIAEALTGWSLAEAAGRELRDVFHVINEQDRRPVPNPVDEVLRSGTIVGLADHTALVARDGLERPIENSAAPIRDADERVIGVVLVFHDVTARRDDECAREEMLQRERASRAEAEAAARVRDAFLARASHELRTPLTAAIGTIRLLGRAMKGDLPEDPALMVDIARRNLDNMLALINSLLDASKLSAGEEALVLEAVDLAAVVRACLDVVGAAAREKGVHLETRVPEGLIADTDAFKLEQVVVNLVANGIKFTPPGGSVVVEASEEAGGTVLRVQDTGEGLAQEHLGPVFEPFFQVTHPARRRQRGTGLGLAICRQIVHLHGGRIWAESEGPGAGSTFTVWLPRRG